MLAIEDKHGNDRVRWPTYRSPTTRTRTTRRALRWTSALPVQEAVEDGTDAVLLEPFPLHRKPRGSRASAAVSHAPISRRPRRECQAGADLVPKKTFTDLSRLIGDHKKEARWQDVIDEYAEALSDRDCVSH